MSGSRAGTVLSGQPYHTYGAMPQYSESQGQGYLYDLAAMQTKHTPFARGPRRSLNLLAVVTSLLLPWVLFAGIFGLTSFSMQSTSPGLVKLVCMAGGLLVLALAYFAVQAWRRRAEGHQDFSWYIFLCLACLAALIAAIVLGHENFISNMRPFLEISSLNVYSQVDPAKFRGQQLMDAGRLNFVEGTHLDLTRSMGFKNGDFYCVAPIVANATGSDGPVSLDFWAVGTNCCSHAADFHCGEFDNPNALSGLRVMQDGDGSFFRLAVQQAEVAYGIQALHPIFMHWMTDPSGEVSSYQDDGFKFYMAGIFGFFAAQVVAVITAVIAFSKMGL